MLHIGSVESVLRDYPRIFFACHRRHTRDPQNGSLVSEKQVQVLNHLDEINAISLTALAGHVGVTLGTMSITVDRLVRRGYVARTPNQTDRRKVLLRLTAGGARVSDAHSVLDPELVDAMVGALSDDDRVRALAGLSLLANAAISATKARRDQSRSG